MINGQLVSLSDTGVTYIKDGYNTNDILYSLINIQMDKIKIAPWSLYEVKDDSSLKSYNSMLYNKSALNLKVIKELRYKALVPIADNKGGKWSDLLKYPNEYETFNDFIAKGCGYKMLTGNKYIWADILPGGKNGGKPNALWVMPSQFVSIYATMLQTWPLKVLGYWLTLFPKQQFNATDIMHEKTPNFDADTTGNFLYGISPVKAALMRLNQSNSTLRVNTAKIQNGGISAIVYPKSSSWKPNEVDAQMRATKNALINELTGPDNWGKITTSNMEIGVEKLGMSPVELDIYNAQLSDMRFMCNVYGVPSQLMNDPQRTAHNNVSEAEKALTTRCALPQLVSARDNLNRTAHDNWGLPQNWIIDFDISAYPELQDDLTKTAQWVEIIAKYGALSPNEIRELMNLETIDNHPIADEPCWHTETGEPLSERQAAIAMVDQTLNADTNQNLNNASP